MKTTCDIIQDLLPLYCDNACSEDSKQAVEAHIEECEQCRNDLLHMQKEIKEETTNISEQKVAKAAKSAWNKKKTISFVAGCLSVLLIISLVVGVGLAHHALNSADADDYNSLRAHAEEYLGCQIQSIKQIEIKGNYLAALCKDEYGGWQLCVFERDGLFHNRWVATGGRRGVAGGKELSSYNLGDSNGNAVIIIFGGDIRSEIKSYKFVNGDITYLCPANKFVLDIFIIQDQSDINGCPIELDENGEEITDFID